MKLMVIGEVIKAGLAGGLLACALTGCCLFGSKRECCASDAGCATKKSGVNTSLTLGVGTDGIKVGSSSNVGAHEMSAGVGASVDGDGLEAGVNGGVK